VKIDKRNECGAAKELLAMWKEVSEAKGAQKSMMIDEG